MTVENFRSQRERRMDDLAIRLGELMDGEKHDEVMFVCGALIGYLIAEVSPDRQEVSLSAVFKFIREVAERRRDDLPH